MIIDSLLWILVKLEIRGTELEEGSSPKNGRGKGMLKEMKETWQEEKQSLELPGWSF